MTQGSAGVKANEIDLTGPVTTEPTGIPAGVIGTANKGPAFVPVTVGNIQDFFAKFGRTDGKKFGPLAVNEWLRNANSVTYIRTLGAGDGKKRDSVTGDVYRAGLVVGSELPDQNGIISNNPYANDGGSEGRTYFLGSFMSESLGSTYFSDPGLQTNVSSSVILRGVLMAPSGVVLTLSSTLGTSLGNETPASNLIAIEGSANLSGSVLGAVNFNDGKNDFVVLLNGHKGTDSSYPNVITASLDPVSPNYFSKVFNSDPYKVQESGHYLYANWDILSSQAVVTGSGLLDENYGWEVNGGYETSVFLTTSSLGRNTGDDYVPNFETFEDRFSHAKSPWIVSQRFAGVPQNLFRFHALDAGDSVLGLYKISIENLKPSNDPTYDYGTFDVVIRDWDDYDGEERVLESFRGCSLDPSSDLYISKKIGDAHVFFDFDRDESSQKIVVDGNYPARSNYVRVEVDEKVENGFVNPLALPVGFRGIDHLVTSGSKPLASFSDASLNITDSLKRTVTPPLPLRNTVVEGTGARKRVNSSLYWGVQFEHVKSVERPNESFTKNESIESFAKYFPDHVLDVAKFITGSNNGQPDSVEWGIIDADRFCSNFFTLENIQITTGSAGKPTSSDWKNAQYIRVGPVTENDSNKTRGLKVSDLSEAKNRLFAKFTVLMQGGWNGLNIFDKESYEMTDTACSADAEYPSVRGALTGSVISSYLKALDIMSNVVNTDIQLLAIPGIREELVTNAASEAVKERFDALYLMDVEKKDALGLPITGSSTSQINVANTVQHFAERNFDNSFAAAYFPDVIVADPTTQTNVKVPPSVVVLGAMALNDRVGYPWLAPAGLTRGALSSVIDIETKFNQSNLDELYNNGINPLVSPTAGSGVTVWGQKTLQASESALNRVNVRRLLIEIRRQVREIAQTILFEPNRAATLARFTAAITPRLTRIQSLAGLDRFKIVIDSSTTTQSDIENNTIRGKIFVQPTKSIEFVSLDFVAANSV